MLELIFHAMRPRSKFQPSWYDYNHSFLYDKSNNKYLIRAGCRRFASVRTARRHWLNSWRPWLNTEANEFRNAWSLKFVARCERYIKSHKKRKPVSKTKKRKTVRKAKTRRKK